jgi:hypothetical protein
MHLDRVGALIGACSAKKAKGKDLKEPFARGSVFFDEFLEKGQFAPCYRRLPFDLEKDWTYASTSPAFDAPGNLFL